MRLEKIKLAGFKSFVDPTTVEFPSNLGGIVGPNGCGKSNVIDAVRWVMGESSAKYLRGEASTDVIFNGSTHRKPVGKASVEMIFDNRDGKVGGEFANYSQISIRREIDRDAQSNYFLNGTRCRRRDIHDVFYGTGLSARGYAIIEQGMINRIIESKPQDLRVNFEEVAGISKYKERRRETENRIRHTKDNLSRILDLSDELEKQLERLKRQSSAAERYKELKAEEREVKGQLLTLRWQGLSEAIESHDSLLTDGQLLLDSKLADQQGIETALVKLREEKNDLLQKQGDIQNTSYKFGNEITRLEQMIQHHKTRQEEMSLDLEQTEQTLREAQEHLENDQMQIEEFDNDLSSLEPELEKAQELNAESESALREAEQAVQEWQQRWDEFNTRSAKANKTVEIERTRITHIEKQQADMSQRLLRVQEERDAIDYSELQRIHQALQQQTTDAEEAVHRCEEQLKVAQDQLRGQRETNQKTAADIDRARSALQQARGRHASLEALQQAALGQKGAAVQWLEKQDLAGKSRLAQHLQVDSAWEKAVEAVLGAYLEAVCVDSLDPLQSVLSSFDQGNLILFDQSMAATADGSKGELLSSKINSELPLADLAAGVYVAEDLNAALAMRGRLAAHESVVTKDGICLGRHWLRVAKDRDGKSGVLQREKELRELQAEIEQQSKALAELEEKLRVDEIHLNELEQAAEQAQHQLNDSNKQFADVRAQLHVHQERLQQLKQRREHLENEAQGLTEQNQSANEDLQQANETLQAAMSAMENDTSERESLLQAREEHRERLISAREAAQANRETLHSLDVRCQTTRSQLHALKQSCERTEKQCASLNERRNKLNEELSEGTAPVDEIQAKLEDLLAKRLFEEEKLQEAKQQVSEVSYKEQQQETARKEVEDDIQELRSALEEKRLKVQEHKVRRTTLMEQIQEMECDLEQIVANMPENADEKVWGERLESLANRITRLGPINLAAIDELETETERKEYLDKQRADLAEALETLENAIKKIDHETRTRFKEVFDQINETFQRLFPRVFGGGKAYLELTDDNLLEAGVMVMARPPGKKNSTIHLLSGGEKAMTAVALVFSMFELNPAPFCMLDEVDAPLDDANVLRYSNLVKEMSEKVQFIFITHNKITMEIADQLMGVTMNEPGVSRIVAVDVEKAAQLAEA